MSNRTETSVVAVTGGLIAILLLVVGAVSYVVTKRHEAEAIARARLVSAETQVDAADATPQIKSDGNHEVSPEQVREIRDAITKVFRTQEEAWNRGDVDAFMEHYWKSDDLTFSSTGKTTRGWNATLARYREKYPTQKEMGHLTLDGFEITPLSDSAALVLGEWKLARESEPVSGNYSIILRKINGRWMIVHDHTSRLAE